MVYVIPETMEIAKKPHSGLSRSLVRLLYNNGVVGAHLIFFTAAFIVLW